MVAYAVNLCDLTSTVAREDYCLSVVLQPVLDRSQVIQINSKRFDEMGVRLACDEERALAIVEIVRKHYKRNQLRIYRSITGNGGWKRI